MCHLIFFRHHCLSKLNQTSILKRRFCQKIRQQIALVVKILVLGIDLTTLAKIHGQLPKKLMVIGLNHGLSIILFISFTHRLWTPNECINQRYLKNWADVADKICFGCTKKFEIGIEFLAVQWRLFLLWVSVVRFFTPFSVANFGNQLIVPMHVGEPCRSSGAWEEQPTCKESIDFPTSSTRDVF